jgi:hypothetical protein
MVHLQVRLKSSSRLAFVLFRARIAIQLALPDTRALREETAA